MRKVVAKLDQTDRTFALDKFIFFFKDITFYQSDQQVVFKSPTGPRAYQIL